MLTQSFASRRLQSTSGLAAMLCTLAGLAAPATAQGPFVQIDRLDLSSITFPAGERVDIPTRITDDGVVFGYSTASEFDFVSPLTFGERQFWSASTSGLQLVGPRSLVTLDPVFASLPSDALQRNAANQAIGIVQGASQESVNGWYFDGVTSRNLGLTAAQVPAIDPLNNFPTQINATGSAIGYATNTTIDLPVAAQLQLAWVDIAGEITALGLSGSAYVDPAVNQRKSLAVGINDGNQVIGYSTRFATNGTRASVDGWLYNPTASSYQQITVPGEAYLTSSVFPQFITNDGTVGGFATPNPSFSNATGAFISRSGVTQEVGLTGPSYTPAGGRGFNSISSLFDGGLAFGQVTTLRANNRFSTTVWFAQNGATTRIGPVVGPEGQRFVTSEGEESAFITKSLENGLVAGVSGRVDLPDVIDPLLGDLGSPFPLRRAYLAWVQNAALPASQAVVLGLTDAIHTGPGGEQSSSVTDISSAGIAFGSSNRYTSETVDGFDVARVVGSTGWVYNIASGEFTIIPTPATGNGTVECRPLLVTSRGGVVGFYKVDAGATLAGYKPFYYSPRAGFVGLDVSSSIFSDPGTGEFPVAVSPDGTRVVIGAELLTGDPSLLRIVIEPGCDSIDFNNNTLFPEDQDLVDFLGALAGGPCSVGNTCNDIDFNNDGLFPSDDDLVAFLRVLAGGSCQ